MTVHATPSERFDRAEGSSPLRSDRAYYDPRWIEARFTSHCARCPRIIKPGESAYYFPNSKTIFCDSEDCGKNEARLVEAALFDERMCAA